MKFIRKDLQKKIIRKGKKSTKLNKYKILKSHDLINVNYVLQTFRKIFLFFRCLGLPGCNTIVLLLYLWCIGDGPNAPKN